MEMVQVFASASALRRRTTLALVVSACATLLSTATTRAEGNGHGNAANEASSHDLGWLCIPVADIRISQISAFNRDARMLSVNVPKARFYIEPTGSNGAGRVCVPTVVRAGSGGIPDETLIFERTLHVGNVARSSQAELVITPEDPALDEVTLDIVGLADQWTEREGVATFSVITPVNFPPRTTRTFLGQGDGPPPSRVFAAIATALRFNEVCAPVELTGPVITSFGAWDPQSERVVARGVEPLRLEAGTKLSRCDGLALDTLMVAIALPADDDDDPYAFSWFLMPREAAFKSAEPPRPGVERPATRYEATRPLGGYHVCRQPSWTSVILEEAPLIGAFEFDGGQWRALTKATTFAPQLDRGTAVTLLDERDGWALVRANVAGAARLVAIPSKYVALPSGPAKEATELGEGLCSDKSGVWRATSHSTQAFRVSQDSPGAELAGLWLEIPSGSYLLQICQDADTLQTARKPNEIACKPIIVGGAQGGPGDRFVLVRYAGSFLAVRENELRDTTTGTFTLRRERRWYWLSELDPSTLGRSPWVFGIGPGARLSFVDQDAFGWNLRARVQRLTEDSLGFEGGFGVGGDGTGVFIELVGGVQALVHRFEDVPIELRVGVLGKLDLRASDAGGLGFDVIGKAQFRWVNDVVPVSLDIGLNIGYGGTFGTGGRGAFAFGMPIGLSVELVDF